MIAKRYSQMVAVQVETCNRDAFDHLKEAIKILNTTKASMKEQKRRKYTQKQIRVLAGSPLPDTAIIDVMNPHRNAADRIKK